MIVAEIGLITKHKLDYDPVEFFLMLHSVKKSLILVIVDADFTVIAIYNLDADKAAPINPTC